MREGKPRPEAESEQHTNKAIDCAKRRQAYSAQHDMQPSIILQSTAYRNAVAATYDKMKRHLTYLNHKHEYNNYNRKSEV